MLSASATELYVPLMPHVPRWIPAGMLCLLFASCASLSFERDTQSSGTFTSTAWAFTIFSVDLPKSALNIARENASDANLPHTVVESVKTGPHIGVFDILLEILCVRYAKIEGTWGYVPD